MWPFKRRKKQEAEKSNDETQFVWIPVGEDNPFDASLMDIRAFTLNMVSTTKDRSVAENYTKSRQSDGTEFIGQEPESGVEVSSSIIYPHNGEVLKGIVFKSPVMEVKWDIYAYEDWFYFVRSWTSELIYKVHYQNLGTELHLDKILVVGDFAEEAEQDVHSMMLTHAFGRVWPFYLPEYLQDAEGQTIATYMFSRFGSKATLVTTAKTTQIQLVATED